MKEGGRERERERERERGGGGGGERQRQRRSEAGTDACTQTVRHTESVF